MPVASAGVMVARVREIAADVGRLRLRPQVASDDYVQHVLRRIAAAVTTLDLMVSPSAAEMYRANVAAGIEDEEALTQALAEADRQTGQLRRLLREDRG